MIRIMGMCNVSSSPRVPSPRSGFFYCKIACPSEVSYLESVEEGVRPAEEVSRRGMWCRIYLNIGQRMILYL
jgi:hypothetical protein